MLKTTIAIIVLAVLAEACSKKESCGSIYYAPTGISIDWEGYNDVETVAKYFLGHDSTIAAHLDEPINVCGYFRSDYWCYLTSDSVPPYRYSIPLYIPEGMSFQSINWERKNYITAQIYTLPWDTLCHSIKLQLILKSINNENQ